ncbi:MAG: class I SAM-dependent methyltransferase [Aestuariivirga sp.]
MTELETLIGELVAEQGPMPLDRYMALCLGHPRFGYYMSRDPFGERGDFTTAPEISQMFGELVGVWAMAVWREMGSPSPFALVELGPGRGTLMSDLLRAAKAMPEFLNAAQINLVETSPVLRGMQEELIGSERAVWHEALTTLPESPSIIIANEFFDALPVKQFEHRGGKWFERCVGFEEEKLTIGHAPAAMPERFDAFAYDGAIVEDSPARDSVAEEIASMARAYKTAALIIDYGHETRAPGDTLQAMRAHKFVPVLHEPGNCDLTAHVDFESLASALRRGGVSVSPVTTQRSFLINMGLEERAERLSATASEEQKADIAAAVKRLAGPGDMGNLFKAICAVSPGLTMPFPFAAS